MKNDAASSSIRSPTLPWQSRMQSQMVLTVPVALVFATVCVEAVTLGGSGAEILCTGIAIAAAFALLVWRLRAATPAAALTGGLFTLAFYLTAPGWHSLLWPLLALFLLTFAATRFGRVRKETMHLAEEKHGRSAAQVAANLGAAAIAAAFLFAPLTVRSRRALLIASIAALAEATADTLSSELGEVLGGEPMMLTTMRRAPAGTDGAISLAGTLAGCVGAAAIVLIAMFALPLSGREGLAVFAAGIFGLFTDSFLGATLERRGWLNNDAVNFLSTCAAALCGAVLAQVLIY